MRVLSFTAILALLAAPAYANPAPTTGELAPPVRLDAAGKPIDTDIGHAAPFVVDWDQDGKLDLVVGQFGEGKLKIFRNLGSTSKPQYAEPSWFEAAGSVAKVPTG
jgi:hypothetical protein